MKWKGFQLHRHYSFELGVTRPRFAEHTNFEEVVHWCHQSLLTHLWQYLLQSYLLLSFFSNDQMPQLLAEIPIVRS